jgi:hypothetical protein
MVFLLLLLALFLAVGVLAATGRTPDTTDPRFGVGALLDDPQSRRA